MRNTLAIFRRELLAFFVSPIAYFVITGFILLGGYFFFNLLTMFNAIVQRFSAMPYRGEYDAPNLNQWVVEPFYQTLVVVLVFLIPLLTMRVLAEEKKRGTFELLATSPISVAQIILGKFLGLAFVILVMVGMVFCFPLFLIMYSGTSPEILPILSGMLAMLLCALAFASIGMAASSLTENQIVAGVSSMVTLLLLYVIHSPAESLEGASADILNRLSPVIQVRDMMKGVITLEALAYFVSLIVVGLFLSQRALEAHRWR